MSYVHMDAVHANANPTKSFFIAMLTRDIDLSDCILDLLDNAVDGIGESAKRKGVALDEVLPFEGHEVEIHFDKFHFAIKDRSGGIPLKVATDYAFRFGRPDDAPTLKDGTIGLYGIGMKRAVFKMGNHIVIRSSTGDDSFLLDLDVEKWRRNPQTSEDEAGEESLEWSFDLSQVRESGTEVEVGTSIRIEQLHEGISRQFDNPSFMEKICRVISRDYAFILSRGLKVAVNGRSIEAVMPVFRESPDIAPFRHVEIVDGVRIEVTAGLADPPPDDTSALARNPDSGVYGWYVVCNDRVVVSADKSADTGWGMRPVPAWHPQFAGFMGVLRFESTDPRKLPWKTTKRDVETSNPLFQRMLPTMMRATKKITDYTNTRRAESKRLKTVERAAKQVPVARVTGNVPARVPAVRHSNVVVVEYVRDIGDVQAAAEALGLIGVSPSDVGMKTFDYFFAREVRR